MAPPSIDSDVLLGPGPRIADVRAGSGSPAFRAAARRLPGAGASFPTVPPDTDTIRLPVHGLLTCSPAAGCSFILLRAPLFATTQVQQFGPPLR